MMLPIDRLPRCSPSSLGVVSPSKSTAAPCTAALVVCASGATRSGKSNLAASLKEVLAYTQLGFSRVAYFDQDDFTDRELARYHSPAGKSLLAGFEDSGSIKHEELRAAVTAAAASHDIVIVEGFRAFYDPELVSMCDVMLWLEVDRATCRERRMATKRCKAAHFDECLWPLHEEYKRHTLATYDGDARLHVLDGQQPAPVVLADALGRVQIRQAAKAEAEASAQQMHDQKEFMKLQKKLRDIEKLEVKLAAGGKLDKLQIEKVGGKAALSRELMAHRTFETSAELVVAESGASSVDTAAQSVQRKTSLTIERVA